jgi:acetate kinase
MLDGILVINAGSSSIKFSVYLAEGDHRPILSRKGQVEGIGVDPHFIAKAADGRVLSEEFWHGNTTMRHQDLFKHMIDWIQGNLVDARLKVAGHRVVHGGSLYSHPVLVTDEVLAELEKLVPLAPLHEPHNIAPIRALAQVNPGMPQVACFDTAFHRTAPVVAQSYALPRALTNEGVKRYGFHGLSFEYIAGQLRQRNPALARGKVIVCHLGSGASMCAIKEGKSVATTLGFSTLDGLPMGTRTGNLDPGVVLYLLQQKGMSLEEVETLLYKKSGLLGMSGISNDMRVLLKSGENDAAEAVEMFIYRVGREIGSLAAAMGGIDGLVFTAGIGEHSPEIRSRVCATAEWLGVKIDEAANTMGADIISALDSKIQVWMIPTDEELMIATHTHHVLSEATKR